MEMKKKLGMDYEDLLFYMDQIPGLMIVDKSGELVYLSQQCADYMDLKKETSIGRHIEEVFPQSKMMDIIYKKEPITTDFYEAQGRISWSTRLPLNKSGNLIGVMEYDLFQEFDMMGVFAKKYMNLQDELEYLKEEVKKLRTTKYTVDDIVGESKAIQDLRNQVRQAAKSNSTVIITGETGTGKELVAHAIHSLSLRCLRNFVRINASGFPDSLIESELFGYEEGAFTGARKGGKKGKFELADEGTLFIDEINQMPMHLQPKLLRALQEHEIERVGGNETIPVDIRIIVATNENLEKKVKERTFREDLYYRLNVVEIRTPSLREIKEDIPIIIKTQIDKLNHYLGKNMKGIESDAMKALMEYNWPGNIRELKNSIERAMNYAETSHIRLEDLKFLGVKDSDRFSVQNLKDKENPIEEMKKDIEKKMIIEAIEYCSGNKSKAAELLKISRTLLHQKIKRLNIKLD